MVVWLLLMVSLNLWSGKFLDAALIGAYRALLFWKRGALATLNSAWPWLGGG